MKILSSFNFKPTKKFIFSDNNNKSNINLIKSYKSKSLPRQIEAFNNIAPVKPFTRFIKQKIYASGEDPSTGFIHFMKKDIVEPYTKDISPIYKDFNRKMPKKNNKWSLGTTYKCNRTEFLPKFDPYKEYHFTSRNNKADNYANNYLTTDHISIKIPNFNKTLESGKESHFPYMNMKKQFNVCNESGSFWIPKVYKNEDNGFNRSSVKYNIINHTDNLISGKKEVSLINKTTNNRKKGVSEIFDLQRNFEPNFSPTFNKFYKNYHNGFKKYNGIFSNLYDSFNKNGNIYQPFKKEKKIRKFRGINNLNIFT